MCPRIQTLRVEFALTWNPGGSVICWYLNKIQKDISRSASSEAYSADRKTLFFPNPCVPSKALDAGWWAASQAEMVHVDSPRKELKAREASGSFGHKAGLMLPPPTIPCGFPGVSSVPSGEGFRTFHAHKPRLWEKKRKGNLLLKQ